MRVLSFLTLSMCLSSFEILHARFVLFVSRCVLNFDMKFLGVIDTCLVNIHKKPEFFETFKYDFLKFEAWEHVKYGIT